MQEEILRSLVWTDYRLAVLFAVIVPLILLIWAFVKKADAMVRLLIIYWRVSSLLAITIYILIAAWPIGFVSGFLARVLIPISLWFWVDINEDIDDQRQRPLKLAFTAWRWAVSVYCTLGALASLPFLSCAFSPGAIRTSFCQVGLEPPLLFKQYFHPNSRPGFLAFIGVSLLLIYVLYLSYFVLIRLGKQGRSAMEQ
ncbi:DUF3177 family protein [Microcoleus sp. FACHB-SPT15]|uniref:DUF3177 family protein n=1 Tax=Microcoleus sp. FACHB-SPT15 TaxID=2692830 RepID=UPI00178457C4|nr:DUF3177 family protein [Microcoleus sp. FACHB-SPT15]MBD1808772.1 DUF3177 family protein [Microcoleus sp. FACHB-SPT15]